MKNEAEDIILDRLEAGDQQAYRQVLEQYKGFVYNLAFQILKSPEDAEEVAQDSFIKAFKHIQSFNRKAKFSTWLYRITYNTALSKMRKKKLLKSTINEVEDHRLPMTEFENAVAHYYESEQKRYLAIALEKLKEDEKNLIILYYLQENSIEEVSQITGLKMSNVKVKIHRARKKLYNYLSTILKDGINELL